MEERPLNHTPATLGISSLATKGCVMDLLSARTRSLIALQELDLTDLSAVIETLQTGYAFMKDDEQDFELYCLDFLSPERSSDSGYQNLLAKNNFLSIISYIIMSGPKCIRRCISPYSFCWTSSSRTSLQIHEFPSHGCYNEGERGNRAGFINFFVTMISV